MKSTSIITIAAIVMLFVLFAYACGTPPQPQIVTKIVNVAVPVPCNFDPGPRPEIMTKDQLKSAITAATNFDDRVKILTAQVLLYIGWVPVLEGGLKGCKSVPSGPTKNAGN